MVFPFQSRGLFYVTAFICIISFFLIPVGIIFIFMARKARIEITDTEFVYSMFGVKRIPFSSITLMELLPVVQPRVYQASAHTSFAVTTVFPLRITTTDNKKIKLSLNHFANPNEILRQLEQKTGKRVVDLRAS